MKKDYLMPAAIAMAIVVVASTTAFAMSGYGDNGRQNALERGSMDFPDCGKPVCKKVFVHYAVSQGRAKPPKEPVCFKLMGVKWYSFPVTYAVNPAGSGIDASKVENAVSSAAEEWDFYTSKELFGSYALDYSAAAGAQNFRNEISWGDYDQDGVIAVTTTWYTPRLRRIIEFDILMDTDFTWGIGSGSAMDIQNIATHELGHGIGLSDIYDSACSEATMYGYSTEGETSKRTLAQPDIAGLQKMYG
jgi:hypothetical protein